MPDILKNDFSQGLVTARDRSDLLPGELWRAQGITYRRNDRRAWKILGRVAFGDVLLNNPINGLKLCQFDDGADILIALSSAAIYGSSNPGISGSFASISGGRSLQANRLHGAHLDNKWFLSTGADSNTVLEADNTTRVMGMVAPQSPPTVTVGTTVGTTAPPTARSNSGFTSPEDADDEDDETFAYALLQASGSATCTWTDWANDVAADRRLEILWGLSGAQILGGDTDTETQLNAGFRVTVLMEKSEDGGESFDPLFEQTFTRFKGKTALPSVVTANSDQVQFRATLTYVSGTSACSLRIYEARILTGVGGVTSPFDADPGHRWAVAEYSDAYGIQSPPSEVSPALEFISGSGHLSATVDLPASALNAFTTHWIVYRNSNGGSVPKQLGEVGMVPVSETTFVDDFRKWASTEQPLPIVPLKSVRRGNTELVLPRDSKPPQFDHIGKFKGQIVGVKGRTLYWAEPGLPESVPEINNIGDFEMEERDELVGTMQIGDTLWVGMTNAALFIDDLPYVADGQLIQPPKREMSGFPGCTSSYGFTTYEEQNTPRGAWVSTHGIYATDGFRAFLLTQELDWENTVSVENLSSAVLHWNQRTGVLKFAYASGSDGNDRYMYLHMDRSHRKQSGMPKITGPHLGKIRCMASGVTGGSYRVWSGHNEDGKVYLEETGVLDKSIEDELVRIDVETGRSYIKDRSMYFVISASLRHTEADGKTITVTSTTGRDDSATEHAETQTVKLNGHRGTEFFIGQAGEWSEFRIVGANKASYALQELNIKARKMGQAGTVLT